MSVYYKAVVAALLAVGYAGLTAWQVLSAGGPFHAVDLFPLTAAVGGAVLTYLVPVLPEFPHLKTWVTGVLQAVAAVGVLFQDSGTATNVAAVLLAVLGTLAVHNVTNAPGAVPAAHTHHAE